MKGVDVVGPLLEPTPVEGAEAKTTKDGKQFDTLLAEAVEVEAAGGKEAVAKGKLQKAVAGGVAVPKDLTVADVPKGELLDKSRVLELPVAPRSIHNAIQQPVRVQASELVATPALAGATEALVAEPTEKLDVKEELKAPTVDPNAPVGPEAMQQVLAQVATVVARIVAPKENSAAAATPQVNNVGNAVAVAPAPAPTKDAKGAPVRPSTPDLTQARDFADAMNAFDDLPPLGEPPDVNNAVTVRPGPEVSAPANVSVTGLPQLAPQVAPAASSALQPAAAPVSAPVSAPTAPASRLEQMMTAGQSAKAPVRAAAEKVLNAFKALSPFGQAQPTPAPPDIAAAARSLNTANTTITSNTNANATASPDTSPLAPNPLAPNPPTPNSQAPNPLAGGARPNARIVITPTSGPDMPTLRPGAEPSASNMPTIPAPAPTGQPVPAQPTATIELKVQPQSQLLSPAQPANSNAVAIEPNAAPVVAQQVQQAVSEEVQQAAGSERQETGKDEPRERVHGFERSGWAGGHAMSAYGGRGHEGGERGDRSDREETSFKREDERAERIGEAAHIPDFIPPIQEQKQLLQAAQQPQEVRTPDVPQNAPAAPAAPVQELPDIVFQGRPDPTAATENASISLHHPDLGPIQLEVHREQGRVEVHAVIESHHAQAVLRANENGIRQGVQQSGMTFSALRVRVRGEEQPTSRQGQQRRRRSNERES